MSRPYAEVIGDPIAQSKSPTIHNFWLAKLGIDAEYRACHVRAEELEDYFARRRGDAEWRGCNVTMPHKQAAMDQADLASEGARAIAAVNCVYRHGDQLVGDNTDGEGFLDSLPSHVGHKGLAIIVGAGGAARAVAAALWTHGFQLAIANRTRDNARVVADAVAGERSVEIGTPSLEQLRDIYLGPRSQQPQNLTLLVNTSLLGMSGKGSIDIDLAEVPKSVLICDIVYSPLETPLLAQARRHGLETVDGLGMLIGQAAIAFEKFFGQPAPREHDAELRALLTV
ncbi:MAG: shikimate dehydrogenase [Burkholderiales bacterium]